MSGSTKSAANFCSPSLILSNAGTPSLSILRTLCHSIPRVTGTFPGSVPSCTSASLPGMPVSTHEPDTVNKQNSNCLQPVV